MSKTDEFAASSLIVRQVAKRLFIRVSNSPLRANQLLSYTATKFFQFNLSAPRRDKR